MITVGSLAAVGLGGTASAGRKPKKQPPREWDERILEYAEFVEDERDLEFDHPVEVEFLTDRKFEKLLRDDSKTTKEERELEEQIGGEFLALGLIGEGIDFSEASEDLAVEGTVGFYDPLTEELVVRGKNLKSVNARITVVHELTHALQDQHFDLDELYDETKSGSESYALDFLVEGDATAVETAYLEQLSEEEQEDYFGEIEEFTEAEDLPEDAPYALDIFASAPYVLGESYVYALPGETEGRNRAFRHPPKTEELLVDPLALEERQRAKKVPRAKVEDGEKKAYDPEQFGVITLYLMLATRIDVRTALAAVTGWGGDSYVGFKADDKVCVRINITGDTATDTDELEAALIAWQATMPAGAVEVQRKKAVITTTACEAEGVTAPTVEKFDSIFYGVLGQRIYVVLDLVNIGLDLEDALCVGDWVSTDPAVIAAFDLAFLEDREPTEADYAILDQAYLDASEPCGVEPLQ
jgi:hypothetical protein